MAEPELGLRGEAVSVDRGALRVLHDVSFAARPGELLAILGPNGAGKSTLLRAAAGLLQYRGRIWLDGDDARGLAPRERALRLGYVPQQSSLRCALSVREVVALGRYAHHRAFVRASPGDAEAIERALARTALQPLAERSYLTLSAGEQRRVLIARGLASGARTLCLDEPTTSLDVGHALQIYALLRGLASEGHAIAVVLHPLDDAWQHADRALLLARGRALLDGSAREVIESAALREVYGVELRPGAALGFRLAEGATP